MGSRHGDCFWEEEKNNIGLKLMQGMGWQTGSGLGRSRLGSTSVIKVKKRKGMEGIGTEKDTGRDEMWTAATSAYNDLLKRLASGGEANSASVNTTAAIQQHKSRQQLYSRFKKSNRTYSEKDREQIFGRRDATFSGMTTPGPGISSRADDRTKMKEDVVNKSKKEVKKDEKIKSKIAQEAQRIVKEKSKKTKEQTKTKSKNNEKLKKRKSKDVMSEGKLDVNQKYAELPEKQKKLEKKLKKSQMRSERESKVQSITEHTENESKLKDESTKGSAKKKSKKEKKMKSLQSEDDDNCQRKKSKKSEERTRNDDETKPKEETPNAEGFLSQKDSSEYVISASAPAALQQYAMLFKRSQKVTFN